jgi:serine/threonine-protein kinase
MAPELWAGRPHSPATDLYAATAVFFESITGSPPFSGSEIVALGMAHQRAAIPATFLPPVARKLVIDGLAKDPRDRPSGAAQFRRDLDSAARSFLGTGWRDSGRRWLAAAAAARADDGLPTLPPATPPAVLDDEADGFVLPELAYSGAQRGPARVWRIWAGVAAAVVTLLVVLVVAAHALAGPGDAASPTSPGVPVFSDAPGVTSLPSEAAATATAGETVAGTTTPAPSPARTTPIPTSDQTISVAPVTTPTPTLRPTPTACLPVLPPLPPRCPTPTPTPIIGP